MSTVQRLNLEPKTDIVSIFRKDFTLADPTLLLPDNAVCLTDGEWVTLDSSYKLIRASAIGTVGNASSASLVYPVWAERGNTPSQAIRKASVWFQGPFEADTRIFNASVTVGNGAAITAVGQGLKVATITLTMASGGTRNFSGLVGHGGTSDTAPIVGYVTRLPATNGGKLRFQSGGRR